jgi:protein-disulfide isomerase
MEPVLQQALKKYPDTVRLVYRNFPLTEVHPQAMQAAQAAMCANKAGKFWEMHDALMSTGSDLSIPGLRATAAHVGVDSRQFEECVQGQQVNGVIQDDMMEATALAVGGTPALFVNGRLIPGTVSLQTLSGVIDDELRRKTKPSSIASASLTRQR